ncbi:MAG: S41 family peptidase [Syntrophothermus sp.]
MRIKIIILLFILCFTSFSCSTMIIGPDPENTPENNFDILWRDFDQTYSLFEIKQVNWDSAYSVFRPRVTASTTGAQLFSVISEMLDLLKDGHVNIYTSSGNYSYDFLHHKRWKSNSPGFSKIATRYLASWNANGTIAYGRLSDDIGYIYISTFGSESDKYQWIDYALTALSGVKGIIIDIRDNGGGSDSNSKTIAGRFADKKRLYRYFKYKNGPGHNDFARLQEDFIEPSGNMQFTRPAVLLTNRYVFSAAEDFVLAMKEFPHVTVLGDTTGGGLGNPVNRELPNGWKYRLPRWVEYDSEMKCYEGIGYPPDIPVWTDEESLKTGKDWVLEQAAEYLKGKL